MGYEKRGPLDRAGEEIDEVADGVRAAGETSGNELDDVSR